MFGAKKHWAIKTIDKFLQRAINTGFVSVFYFVICILKFNFFFFLIWVAGFCILPRSLCGLRLWKEISSNKNKEIKTDKLIQKEIRQQLQWETVYDQNHCFYSIH